MSVIPAATVILVRESEQGIEVFLVKRHKKSSFMSNAFVFPGGKIDPTDADAETAAARELFEEAGVLLADPPADAARVAVADRARLLAGDTAFNDILAAAGLGVDRTRLHFWSRWVTPVQEPRRFDAEFFVAELPPGQTPSFDQKETVEELWISPAAALERQAAGELRLAPPQLRTFHELAAAATDGGIAGVIAASGIRRMHRAAICPRIVQDEGGIAIVLPWDPSFGDTEEAVAPAL